MSSPLRPANRLSPAQMQAGRLSAVANGASSKVEIIQPTDYIDRRSETRTDCDDRGALLFMPNKALIQCRILDQSPSGARVSFDTVGNIPSEVWLIDLDTNMVRRGSSAWSTPTRMGLKFNFVQTLVIGQTRPAKVPAEVFEAWLKLTGQAEPEKPAEKPPEKPDDSDVLYFD